MIQVVVIGLVLVDRPDRLDCVAAVRTQPPGLAVTVCQREYEITHAPPTGIRLADALQQSGNLTAAKALATDLLATPVRADALQILGRIASAEGRLDDAVSALENALKLHRDKSDLARDHQALGDVLQRHSRFSEALSAFDACITEAREGDDKQVEYYCHISAATVLAKAGYFAMSQQELDAATPLTTSALDRMWLAYERGNLLQEVGHDEQAIKAFERALALNQEAQIAAIALTAELNLAYSLAQVGRTEEAERHLAIAQALDLKHEHDAIHAQIAAQIAYRRGNLALASSLNEQAYAMITGDDDTADDLIAIATMQARIALAETDPARAVVWAQRGVDQAEQIRARQSAVELRPWILSTRREPYELLFVALARADHVDDAVMTLDLWHGRTLLDAMARSSPRTSLDLPGAARRIERLGAWLPITSSAPIARLPDHEAVLETLRTTDLVALIVADHDLWRLTASHGRRHLVDLGPLTALQDRLDRFSSAPTDKALEPELGELLLGDKVFQPTRETLHVLLDSQLAALPIVALRRHGRALIAVRPVVRVPRLPETPCVAARRPTHATVLADADGSLPAARREAATIATLLHTTSAAGAAATSQALFAATNDDVLHAAVHAGIGVDGGMLKLYDREVSALEISARKFGPSLVVLPACSSARSHDTELAGSLATGFLAAGSAQVVATLRPISDTGASELSTRFYRADGVADPVRALAEAQAALAETSDVDWPNFAVFGHDVCSSAR